MKKLSILFSLTVLTSIATADQCAWNKYATSAAAREIIKNMAEVNGQKPSVYTYCEPCDQKEMLRVYLTKNAAAQGNQNPYHVTVNRMTTAIAPDTAVEGKIKSSRSGLWQLTAHHSLEHGSFSRFDLAYTYVKITADRYANLAYIVGCPAEGVTPVIRTDGDLEKNEGFDAEGQPETDDGILIRDYQRNPLRGEG